MNNKQLIELTDRLSKSLDKNYDVTDMAMVLYVISLLEGTAITKEQLEATRLAKFINQLRRRTQNENLARRAKSLLKKWREMVGIKQSNDNSSSCIGSTGGDDNNIIISQSNLQNSTIATGEDFSRSSIANAAFKNAAIANLSKSANLFEVVESNKTSSNKKTDVPESEKISHIIPAEVGGSSTKVQPKNFLNIFSEVVSNDKRGSENFNANTFRPTHKTEQIKESRENNHLNSLNPSSSNNDITPPKFFYNNDPIVIDIQDSSNSSSNLVAAVNDGDISNHRDTSTLKEQSAINSMLHIPSVAKSKKSKREKKRKDRHNNNTLVIPDDSLSSNQPEKQEQVNPIRSTTKTHMNYPITNISEILSLSNSSMSSFFPLEISATATKHENLSNFGNESQSIVASHNKNLSKPDLTFTGKFKKQQESNSCSPNTMASKLNSANATPNNSNNSLQHSFDGFNGVNENELKTNQIVNPHQFSSNKIVTGGINIHSNDSSSCSRLSYYLEDNNNAATNVNSFPHRPAELISNITTTNSLTAVHRTNSPIVEQQKIPKKRGRKKGSKGVDSVIAKETSLSSQMLLSSLSSSGGKKVKTTRELYADMQNRKLGVIAKNYSKRSSPKSTNIMQQTAVQSIYHPTPIISRPTSSCSDISIQTPDDNLTGGSGALMAQYNSSSTSKPVANNTIASAKCESDDSEVIYSEPSHDSSNNFLGTKSIKSRVFSIDTSSNSQYSTPPPTAQQQHNDEAKNSFGTINSLNINDSIEMKLQELVKQLPIVSSSPLDNMEKECLYETIPCTCKIIEVFPAQQHEGMTEETTVDLEKSDKASQNTKYNKSTDSNIPIETDLTSSAKAIHNNHEEIKELKPELKLPKPKKSIFDLDFDEDEDPLNTLFEQNTNTLGMDVTTGAQVEKHMSNAVKDISHTNNETNTELSIMDATNLNTATNLQSFPIYQIEEDPNCPAKQRFDIQTQKITNFHINALHNCFIPNVNGNWDNGTNSTQDDENQNFDLLDKEFDKMSLDEIEKTVVPKYSSLSNERIPKDLSHIKFTPNFQSKRKNSPQQMKKFYLRPFLGVAERFQSRKTTIKETSKRELVLDEGRNECIKTKSINLSSNNDGNIETLEILEFEKRLLAPVKQEENSISSLTDDNQRYFDRIEINNPEVPKNNDNGHERSLSIKIKLTENLNKHKQQKRNENDCVEKEDIHTNNSSSCSNSSLRQTTQSINNKLRHQRYLQQQQHEQEKIENTRVSTNRKRKRRKKHRRNSISSSSDNESNDDVKINIDYNEYEKRRIRKKPKHKIKRLKIAINGDMTTQRQISYSENTSSSDDKKMKKTAIGESNINDGNLLTRSSPSSSSSSENQITSETDNKYNENDDGAFHEVFTRDIFEGSSTNNNNNHIVLTIKKTPGGKSFNSNSNLSYNCDSQNSIQIKTATESVDPQILKEKSNDSSASLLAPSTLKSALNIQHNDESKQINASMDSNVYEIPKTGERENLAKDDNLESIAITHWKSKPVRQKKRCDRNNDTNALKLENRNLRERKCHKSKPHHQLFFPYELYTKLNDGSIKSIFSISSCTSSCSCSGSEDEKAICWEDLNLKFKKKQLTVSKFEDKQQASYCITNSSSSSSSSNSLKNYTSTDCEFEENLCRESSEKSGENDSTNFADELLDKENDNKEMNERIKDVTEICENEAIKNEEENTRNILLEDNNGLLPSFNNIYQQRTVRPEYNSSNMVDAIYNSKENVNDLQLRHENKKLTDDKQLEEQRHVPKTDYINVPNNDNSDNSCLDDNTNLTVKFNFENNRGTASLPHSDMDMKKLTAGNISEKNVVINCKSKSSPAPPSCILIKEYKTGMRSVDEDVNDDDGNNCAKLQHFKEWHQVLQLRSYNDELLTVLPYVVLD